MPIFTQSLRKIDESKPQEAIKIMANHIKYIQEQLEYTLHNLDSEHITEIDTDKTVVTDSTGSSSLGSYISLVGANGETFTVGKNQNGKFEFVIKGKSGTVMNLDSSGNINITGLANLTVDGGTW